MRRQRRRHRPKEFAAPRAGRRDHGGSSYIYVCSDRELSDHVEYLVAETKQRQLPPLPIWAVEATKRRWMSIRDLVLGHYLPALWSARPSDILGLRSTEPVPPGTHEPGTVTFTVNVGAA